MLKIIVLGAIAQLSLAQPWHPTVPVGPSNGGKSKDFPPGFNGMARTPPQGARLPHGVEPHWRAPVSVLALLSAVVVQAGGPGMLLGTASRRL